MTHIYHSPYPDVVVPDVPVTDFVLGADKPTSQRIALIEGETGRALTYAELTEAVERVAAGLQRVGFGKGAVAAICTPNRPEFAIAFHAVARAGGAITTLNPASTRHEIERQLVDSGATVAFTVTGLAGLMREAGGARLAALYCFDREVGEHSFAALASTPAAPAPVPVNPARDVVALPYSSGTTGLPKGVMLTHRNLVANLLQLAAQDEASPNDTTMAVLPFFHIYGLNVVLGRTLQVGSRLVTLSRFEMAGYLEAIERWGVTRLPLAPPTVLRLTEDPLVAEHDLRSVRVVLSGAAPLSPALTERVRARFGWRIKQGYGMTELSPGSHMQGPDPAHWRPGSVGVIHPSTEVRLVDPETGEDAPGGGPGEIWVRGPQVMRGYLNRPDATAETVVEDGWLRTGDIATVEPDGNFFVVDRLKELIKYKGFQVAPAELEEVLLTHPEVADAAVIPAPDDEAGEVPRAVVVRRPDSDVGGEELMTFVAERVAPYKRVRQVEFAPEVPRSASGKILRRVLVDRARGWR